MHYNEVVLSNEQGHMSGIFLVSVMKNTNDKKNPESDWGILDPNIVSHRVGRCMGILTTARVMGLVRDMGMAMGVGIMCPVAGTPSIERISVVMRTLTSQGLEATAFAGSPQANVLASECQNVCQNACQNA